MTESDVPFEHLAIELPDYVKPDGSKASQPFSKSSHDLKRPENLRAFGEGDGNRTGYFKQHLVRMRNALGKPVPYRFYDAQGKKRSMDAGCLKFVGPDGQNLAEFVLQNGYIIAVEPKLALLAQYAGHLSDADNISVANDIKDILTDTTVSETTRQQLIEARIGQGQFRKRVLARWEGRCALTGCDLEPVIRASHIVPWHSATNDERLDPENGLPLVATLDALFDVGLIAFEDDGNVLISKKLSEKHRALVPAPRSLAGSPSLKAKAYLARHRKAHGFAS